MAFSLISSPWLPLRRRSGLTEWVSPASLTDALDTDPFVSPDWGRADFDMATIEFLIGLLATAFHPKGEEGWRELWRDPPMPERLAEAFAPFEAAFRLDGDGPRFMQELGGVEGEPSPVSGLFIEAPGANTEKNNADLFQKRGRFERLGLPAAAMALFTLQTYAPSGGAGHRTSMRGGGPLTTLVMPYREVSEASPSEQSLWRLLWLNVPLVAQPLPQRDSGPTVFPWLAPTITSEKDKVPIDLETLHPLAQFWWMPRRIRLDIETGPAETSCDVTGKAASAHVSGYRTKPWGMNGAGAAHPLSPLYRNKAKDTEWLFVHPQPGGLPYHLWVDLVFAHPGVAPTHRPADIVTHVMNNRQDQIDPRPQLLAAGYDMENMKARGFVEIIRPLFVLDNEQSRNKLAEVAHGMAQAAGIAARATRSAVALALNFEKTDASRLSSLTQSFYDRTEGDFFDCVDALATALAPDDEAVTTPIRQRFLEQSLRPTALDLFDKTAPLNALGTRIEEIERHIGARRGLVLTMNGYGKEGDALFKLLGLPVPEGKASKSRKATAQAEART